MRSSPASVQSTPIDVREVEDEQRDREREDVVAGQRPPPHRHAVDAPDQPARPPPGRAGARPSRTPPSISISIAASPNAQAKRSSGAPELELAHRRRPAASSPTSPSIVAERLGVAVLLVAGERLLVRGLARRGSARGPASSSARRGRAVAEPLEVAGVHLLLELAGEREREHRLAQVDGLAHERVARPSATTPRRGAQVVDERLVRERPVARGSVLLVVREAVARPVDVAGDAARLERCDGRLADPAVDEQVRRRARARRRGSRAAGSTARASCASCARGGWKKVVIR